MEAPESSYFPHWMQRPRRAGNLLPPAFFSQTETFLLPSVSRSEVWSQGLQNNYCLASQIKVLLHCSCLAHLENAK